MASPQIVRGRGVSRISRLRGVAVVADTGASRIPPAESAPVNSTEDIIRRHDIVLRRHSTEFTKVHGTLSRLESLALEHSEQLTSLQTDTTEVKGSLAELLRRIPPVG